VPFSVWFYLNGLFIQADGTGGASAGASTAFDALIGIDFVDVTLGNSSNGALACARAARNTRVRNFVSHSVYFFGCFYRCKNTTFFIIARPILIFLISRKNNRFCVYLHR
jgi:hypothetical protein